MQWEAFYGNSKFEPKLWMVNLILKVLLYAGHNSNS